MKQRQSIFRKHAIVPVEIYALTNANLSLAARGFYALLCAEHCDLLSGQSANEFVDENPQEVEDLIAELKCAGLILDVAHEH
jgi:hypothetical protein